MIANGILSAIVIESGCRVESSDRADRGHSSAGSLSAAMEIRHRGMAWLAVRWPRHALVRFGRRPLCRGIDRRLVGERPSGWVLQLVDSSRVSLWLGARRGVLRTSRRQVGPKPVVDAHDPHVRAFHGALVLRANVVATFDISVHGRARHRRRMGGWGVAPFRNVAEALASMDGGGASNRSESRCHARGFGDHHFGRFAQA